LGAVHGEAKPEDLAKDATLNASEFRMSDAVHAWRAAGWSTGADAAYLEGVRSSYEMAMPDWPRWRRTFKPLVEGQLRMDITQVAWSNLAKCRLLCGRAPRRPRW